ncbi:DNA polymerase III subunit gamma and tau [Streptomyces venezuelae]|uniref:DNA polymerase III subunit gamma and tau n=1 Tax=Streptomyces venezuelae TaxID=54571 RepID=UPI001F348585|nr:DNA polymerase III subunit gamma and tau [Streptomyces venezuelae]
MSSLALYRRYRPESFAEVIGQEHVTDPLQQALRNNRVNHAYLFSGPRGCGKTTSARILARCLNCEQGPTPTPCGECQSCRDLARNGPGSIDVIEIDAASHGGVDDARDLREKAFFGPASSRYKIYIIDEAHMVTSAGFNALLKVVEEPPEHLKFIFATTEPEKVIGTIRSRTHHYPFRLVPPGTLRDYLGEVCGREGIPVEDGVLPLVVRAGAGSVRDSMSVMDQLLAGAAADGVTYAMATSLLGYTDGSLLDSVVEAFAAGDGAAAFEVVDRVIEGGNDPRRFVADLLERLRDLVILAAVPDAAEKGLIDAPVDVIERMQAQASVFGAAELSRAADLVNTGLTEMRGATSPRLQLELICARVLLPAAFDDGSPFAAQARLAVRELDRTGAFDRAVLAVAGTTGTGWVDPNVAEALEYMYGGDTAIVAVQYSYLPSWVSFLVDKEKAGQATRALLDAVRDRLGTLPADRRPKLVVTGESLGAYAVEASFEGADDLLASTDGALLMGAPNFSPISREIRRDRDPGSPVWRPQYRGGTRIRFAQFPETDLARPASAWGHPRAVYLQNASDPVVWWSPDLLLSRPAWLDEPLGPDITPEISWFPFVAFWQTSVDMAVSYGVDAPHGHRYGAGAVDGWAAVLPPPGWTDADTRRLRAFIAHRPAAY